MLISLYRGYELHCTEAVDIYHNGELVDQAPSLAEATERIDNWMSAP